MADYREISQQYAQGAIKAAMTINGGATVAVLTQSAALAGLGLGDQVRCSLIIWSAGLLVACLVWIVAFLSTRYVDENELGRANFFMYLGVLLLILSLGLFLAGVVTLANGLVFQKI